MAQSKHPPKHEKIRNEIRHAITTGKYKEGQRLPTEAVLVEQYATSRPTVARALRDLQHEGLIARRAGSGTYVKKSDGDHGHLFGLLIPRLGETEIFDPICREMARSSQTLHHALLWAAASVNANGDISEQTWQSCQQCIARKVAGVFFAPLEFTPESQSTNEKILKALDHAGIPVVLLDRDLYRSPRRSRYDRVGIDNREAGFTVTNHLLALGCKRIGFFYRPYSAETVYMRLEGYREALRQNGISPNSICEAEADPTDTGVVGDFLRDSGIDGLICANDITAGNMMRTMDSLGFKTPKDIRVVGIDDVKYASLLAVPLTTLHQPCEHIGCAAIEAMTDRIANRNLPPRDILFHCDLVIRESCGAHIRLHGGKPRPSQKAG